MLSNIYKINGVVFGMVAVFCLMLTAGCAAQSVVASNPPTATLPVSPAALDTQLLATLTPALAPAREFDYIADCVSINSQIPQNIQMSGGLFLYDPSDQSAADGVLMGLSRKSITRFTNANEGAYSFRISPDGISVAYFAFNKNNLNHDRLVIKNFATNSTIEIPRNKEWELFSLRGWLNDKELLITALENTSYPPTFIALNPFTGESSTLPTKFPSREVLPPGSGVSPAEYDPSLNYVLYSARQENAFGFFLFNRSANDQIAFFPVGQIVEAGSPVWSHDGMKFVFASKMGADLFINLGRSDGSATSIVKFSGEMGPFDMWGMTWSPDDRFVAVVLFDIRQEVEKLMLLDLNGQKVLDPCINSTFAMTLRMTGSKS